MKLPKSSDKKGSLKSKPKREKRKNMFNTGTQVGIVRNSASQAAVE